jgi:hypothetical protein
VSAPIEINDGRVISDPSLRKGFAIGLIVVVSAMILLGIGVKTASSRHHRPEGIAERWLAAVSDTTRSGVEADAKHRANAVGPVELAKPLISPDTGGKAAFDDLEVGKARVTGDTARVPFLLHAHSESGGSEKKRGAVILTRAPTSAGWKVVDVDMTTHLPTDRVPSEGGPPPCRAPLSFWIGAIVIAIILTFISFGIVEWASRSAERGLAEEAAAAAARQASP